jgi:hypothetical protein
MEVPGEFPEKNGVGGHRQVFDPGKAGELLHQVDHAFANQRLPSGDPDFVDASFYGQSGQAHDLLIGEDFRMSELRHPFFGHAVTAAKVAAIGDGYAQIIHAPIMGIDETVHFILGRIEGTSGRGKRKKENSIIFIVVRVHRS